MSRVRQAEPRATKRPARAVSKMQTKSVAAKPHKPAKRARAAPAKSPTRAASVAASSRSTFSSVVPHSFGGPAAVGSQASSAPATPVLSDAKLREMEQVARAGFAAAQRAGVKVSMSKLITWTGIRGTDNTPVPAVVIEPVRGVSLLNDYAEALQRTSGVQAVYAYKIDGLGASFWGVPGHETVNVSSDAIEKGRPTIQEAHEGRHVHDTHRVVPSLWHSYAEAKDGQTISGVPNIYRKTFGFDEVRAYVISSVALTGVVARQLGEGAGFLHKLLGRALAILDLNGKIYSLAYYAYDGYLAATASAAIAREALEVLAKNKASFSLDADTRRIGTASVDRKQVEATLDLPEFTLTTLLKDPKAAAIEERNDARTPDELNAILKAQLTVVAEASEAAARVLSAMQHAADTSTPDAKKLLALRTELTQIINRAEYAALGQKPP